jgi:hypothetical protein
MHDRPPLLCVVFRTVPLPAHRDCAGLFSMLMIITAASPAHSNAIWFGYTKARKDRSVVTPPGKFDNALTVARTVVVDGTRQRCPHTNVAEIRITTATIFIVKS